MMSMINRKKNGDEWQGVKNIYSLLNAWPMRKDFDATLDIRDAGQYREQMTFDLARSAPLKKRTLRVK